ncbi:GNAT family N-acetyltransferase [Humibacter ginsenosidimutans]|nr:GNAT family N-acetyltransferase [Humibacter ginsenosidimutans]
MTSALLITEEDPRSADVTELLHEHLADMFATSPAESVHALDLAALRVPSITFWAARSHEGALLGCGALKQHDDALGELKSMRTASAARGHGVASAVLLEIIAECRRRGIREVKLETGTEEYFAPARRLYERHGFTPCAPFAEYTEDPNSAYYGLRLEYITG